MIVAQAALPYLEGTDAARALERVVGALDSHYGSYQPERFAQPGEVGLPAPVAVERPLPEAIIFGDERVSYQFMDLAIATARSVARLMVPRFVNGEWCGPPALGTAWVIAPGLVITNHHVVAARFSGEAPASDAEFRAQAERSEAWFDYRVEGGARDERSIVEVLCMSVELDYAVLRLNDGTGRAPLRIARRPPPLLKGDRLNIVQHPRGGPVRYAIRSNHYVGVASAATPHLLRYLTDTEGGASGSPVLNDSWNVVSLHHASTSVEPQIHKRGTAYVNNEGIAIEAILHQMPASIREVIVSAQHWKADDP